jgi:putative nucleotidyltransferase with HDIG domain
MEEWQAPMPFGRKDRATAKIISLVAAVALISIGHFTIGTLRHYAHVEHVVLQVLYIGPIVAAALWFGTRGALIVLLVISGIYYAYVRIVWPNQPAENANQMAMLAMYWAVGAVSAVLVHLQEKEREAHARAQRLARREAMFQALQTLSDALRLRDEYTRKHSEDVSQLALKIGERMGLGTERLEALRLAGLMHDIGKIGIRDDVLFKPTQLSAEERTRIEQHPKMASKILELIDGAKEIARIVVAHHESPDGSGYPNHLKGDEIPLEARILRVADVFCSLLDERPYKNRLASQEVLGIMRAMMPAKLDPRSMAALEGLLVEASGPASA